MHYKFITLKNRYIFSMKNYLQFQSQYWFKSDLKSILKIDSTAALKIDFSCNIKSWFWFVAQIYFKSVSKNDKFITNLIWKIDYIFGIRNFQVNIKNKFQ